MNKGHLPGLIFREESFHIGDRHKRRKQLLLFSKACNECWLMHKSKMNARFVAADRRVKWRGTMEEDNRKTEPFRTKLTRSLHFGHRHHWYSLHQLYGDRSRSGDSRSFFQALFEFCPTGVALFERNDFLRLVEWEKESKDFTIGKLLITRKLADSAAHGIIALPVPTDEQFRLFLEVFETHAHTSSFVSAGGLPQAP